MARSGKSFSRGKPKFKPQPTALVICEDKKSSKHYLDDACFHFRADVDIDVIHCGKTDPKGIVEKAISSTKHYDTIFCVIDRDEHLNFDEALTLAKPFKKITIITSYPCFEFWLLLHFQYSRKPYRSTLKKSAGEQILLDLKSKPGMHEYAKGSTHGLFNYLLGEKFSLARSNSKRALKDAQINTEPNPSTTFHELIDFIESLSKPLPC